MDERGERPGPRGGVWILLFALLFPTAYTWVYFVLLSGTAGLAAVFAAGKVIQFGLPLLHAAIADRRLPRLPLGRAGTMAGVLLGLAIFGIIVGLHAIALRDSPLLARIPGEAAAKLDPLGLATPLRFAVLGLFYAALHSGLEEYYWRGYVFGRLGLAFPWRLAVAVSSAGFMAHHVVLLGRLIDSVPAVLVFSLAIGAGGAAWAVLYRRSGSLLGPWLSHGLVDLAIFAVGYDLLFG